MKIITGMPTQLSPEKLIIIRIKRFIISEFKNIYENGESKLSQKIFVYSIGGIAAAGLTACVNYPLSVFQVQRGCQSSFLEADLQNFQCWSSTAMQKMQGLPKTHGPAHR